jgi:hypothetical protein
MFRGAVHHAQRSQPTSRAARLHRPRSCVQPPPPSSGISSSIAEPRRCWVDDHRSHHRHRSIECLWGWRLFGGRLESQRLQDRVRESVGAARARLRGAVEKHGQLATTSKRERRCGRRCCHCGPGHAYSGVSATLTTNTSVYAAFVAYRCSLKKLCLFVNESIHQQTS